MHSNPEKIQSYLSSVAAHVSKGHLFPIANKVFPLQQAKNAFNMTFQVKLVAKMVFEHPWNESMISKGITAITGGFWFNDFSLSI